MEIFKGQNIIDFGKVFPDDASCQAYLAQLKWKDGFTCTKCGHTSGCEKSGHKYHCYRCNHVESATAGTLFHRVRFGLRKAFHIVFEMVNSSKGMSSIQIALRYGIRKPTAWTFMHKVRKAMESSQNYPMTELVHAEELFAQAGAVVSAKVITDKWKGYAPLTKQYKIEQIPSNKGKNFTQLHIIIHQN